MTVVMPDRVDDKDAPGALLQITLQAIVDAFAAAAEPLPQRQYVATGQVAVDCEQLTVTAGQLYSGAPGEDPNALQRCDGPRSLVMVAQLWRKGACFTGPRGTIAPTPEAMTKDALQLCRDAWLLLDSADHVNASPSGPFYIGDVTFLDPSGEYVGTQLQLTMVVP